MKSDIEKKIFGTMLNNYISLNGKIFFVIIGSILLLSFAGQTGKRIMTFS